MAYSKRKSASSVAVNSTPVVFIVLASWANRRFNFGFLDEDINIILGTLSVCFYWIKNWIKNK